MRYIYQEPVITTVTDEEIQDEKLVRDLLDTLLKAGHTVEMGIEDTELMHVKTLTGARITRLGESDFDVHAFMPRGSIKYASVPIRNVRKIRLVANKQALNSKYKVTRWHVMDVAEIEV